MLSQILTMQTKKCSYFTAENEEIQDTVISNSITAEIHHTDIISGVTPEHHDNAFSNCNTGEQKIQL